MKENEKNTNNASNVNISNEFVDVSLSGRARDEYKKIKATVSMALAGVSITSREAKLVSQRIDKIYALGRRARKEYMEKKDKASRIELKKIIIIYQYAKNAQKTIERKYMLESDGPDAMEMKYCTTTITRKQAEDEKYKDRKMNGIDMPIVNNKDVEKQER